VRVRTTGNVGCSQCVGLARDVEQIHTTMTAHEPAYLTDEELAQSVEALHAFLRTELFAVATYDAALGKVGSSALRGELVRLRDSHAQRVELLRDILETLGEAAEDQIDEPWGAFANAFRLVIVASDDRTTLDALMEGEGWGVQDYERDLDELDVGLRDHVAGRVLPEQRRTCERVHVLARDATRARARTHAHALATPGGGQTEDPGDGSGQTCAVRSRAAR
jgi:hypothetical protein